MPNIGGLCIFSLWTDALAQVAKFNHLLVHLFHIPLGGIDFVTCLGLGFFKALLVEVLGFYNRL